MSRSDRFTFTRGLLCGAALAVAVLLSIGPASPTPRASAGSSQTPALLQYAPTDYFVTGDSSTATLWRRERDGTLTCVSLNSCRRPAGE